MQYLSLTRNYPLHDQQLGTENKHDAHKYLPICKHGNETRPLGFQNHSLEDLGGNVNEQMQYCWF